MSKLRWAAIGASWIAETRVIPALHALGQDLDLIVSTDIERGRAYADRAGVKHSSSDPAALSERRIEAVYISTVNDLHRNWVEEAAARGIHVFCEKPLADNLDDARAIVDACRTAGVVLGVNHHLVASDAIAVVKRLMDSGEVGEVRAVRIFHAKLLPEFLRGWRLADAPGAGVVPDIGSHDVSVLEALLAPRTADTVTALGVRQGDWSAGRDDASMAVLRYGDVLASTHEAFTTPYGLAGVEVLGSSGTIWAEDLVSQDPIARVFLTNSSGKREIEVPEKRDLYERGIGAFVEAVAGTGAPLVDGARGLTIATIAAAIEESSASRTTIGLESR